MNTQNLTKKIIRYVTRKQIIMNIHYTDCECNGRRRQ